MNTLVRVMSRHIIQLTICVSLSDVHSNFDVHHPRGQVRPEGETRRRAWCVSPQAGQACLCLSRVIVITSSSMRSLYSRIVLHSRSRYKSCACLEHPLHISIMPSTFFESPLPWAHQHPQRVSLCIYNALLFIQTLSVCFLLRAHANANRMEVGPKGCGLPHSRWSVCYAKQSRLTPFSSSCPAPLASWFVFHHSRDISDHLLSVVTPTHKVAVIVCLLVYVYCSLERVKHPSSQMNLKCFCSFRILIILRVILCWSHSLCLLHFAYLSHSH